MTRDYLLDMGNVLLRWDPAALVAHVADDPADRAALLSATFGAPDWADVDAGLLTDEAFQTRAKSRAPERLASQVETLLAHYHRYMTPMPGAEAFLRGVHAQGGRAYLLSNAGSRFPDVYAGDPLFRLLDGAVISARERMAKPNPALFRLAAERFHLDPANTVFLDDMPVNVAAARSVGFDGRVFDGDYPALIARLEAEGIWTVPDGRSV